MNIQNKIRSSVIAAIVGDALGVPVETTSRQELSLCSVKNMLGFGRYDQPQGTWSDDSSMILCTIESLCRRYDLEDLGKTFCSWMFKSHWTATGYVFDAGVTTFLALERIHTEGVSARDSGCTLEQENGNGSLMRILPAALYFHREPTDQFLRHIHEISAITHAHPRSQIGCGLYALLVKNLLIMNDKTKALQDAVRIALNYYSTREVYRNQLSHFMRIISFEISALDEEDINSSGYIIDTLEAAIWCLMKNSSTCSTLLSAVNLGLDTDTTGTVAGGLAGLLYGIDDIPPEWLTSLARYDDIEKLLQQFIFRIPE